MGNSTNSVSSMWLYLQLKKEIQTFLLPLFPKWRGVSIHLVFNIEFLLGISQRFYLLLFGLLDGVCKITSNSQEDTKR